MMLRLLLYVLPVLVAIYAGRVRRVPCTVNTDCTSTTKCADGSIVICQHPDTSDGIKPGGGLCTCSDTTGSCPNGSKEECYGNKAPNLNCTDDARHCYDGNCICDRFPIIGGRK